MFFEIKVDFKDDLISRLNFMSPIKINVVFKLRQNPPFLTSRPPLKSRFYVSRNHICNLYVGDHHPNTQQATNFFRVCQGYILGPHLMMPNGYWIRNLSSANLKDLKPPFSTTHSSVIEFSRWKLKGKKNKKQKKPISNINKIFAKFINLMCDLRSTNFSVFFTFWYVIN